MSCLLVIPAYRESKRLPAFLADLLEQLERAELECDVLVVDDGSGRSEEKALHELVTNLRQDFPRLLNPLCLQRNRGKGYAIRAGWEQLRGQSWVGFVDADGATPAREVCRLIKHAEGTRHGAIFGSRVRMLGRSIERSGMRHLSGRIFAFLVGLSVAPDIYDSQCGMKLVRADVYRRIAPRLRENGFCFDVELLAALLVHHATVSEVPIDWRDVPGSRVSLFRDSAQMAAGLRRISRRKKLWTFSNANNLPQSEHANIGITEPSFSYSSNA